MSPEVSEMIAEAALELHKKHGPETNFRLVTAKPLLDFEVQLLRAGGITVEIDPTVSEWCFYLIPDVAIDDFTLNVNVVGE
jgi:hypothetical protein